MLNRKNPVTRERQSASYPLSTEPSRRLGRRAHVGALFDASELSDTVLALLEAVQDFVDDSVHRLHRWVGAVAGQAIVAEGSNQALLSSLNLGCDRSDPSDVAGVAA